MKTKFTSGKWSQSHRKDSDGMYSTEVYDDRGETICSLRWHTDMYKLLTEFKEFAERQGWDHVLINDAEKLLSKVRGEL